MTAPADARSVARDAATVSTWNLLSRLTGVLRVLMFGGALGATRLGDTYQGSNQVSNVLFELLAAGTLSAVLVPGLVRRLALHDVVAARAFAGVVLGRALTFLVPLVVIGVIASRPLARLLFIGNGGVSYDAQVRLGAFLLVFVLPQLLFYAWGAILTAVLHADGRFAAASLAPVANNLVVSAGLGLLWARGAHGLGLSGADKWVLGGTALGGVLTMTVVPAVAAWRAGLGVRPRLAGAEGVAGVGRDAFWASLVLLPAQVVALGSLLVAGRVSGGVAAYQIAFAFFLLPHALVGHPTATVLYPRLARAVAADDHAALRTLAGSGLEVVAAVMCASAAIAAALAPWLVRLVAVGALDAGDGPQLTATALAWLSVGLPAYAAALLLTRVGYAAGDLRLPARSAVTGAVVAVVVLLAATLPASARGTVAAVALAHTAMAVATAATLLVGCIRSGWIQVPWRRITRYAGVAAGAGVVARLVASVGPAGNGRGAAGAVVALATLAAVASYAGGLAVLGQRDVPRLVGGD